MPVATENTAAIPVLPKTFNIKLSSYYDLDKGVRIVELPIDDFVSLIVGTFRVEGNLKYDSRRINDVGNIEDTQEERFAIKRGIVNKMKSIADDSDDFNTAEYVMYSIYSKRFAEIETMPAPEGGRKMLFLAATNEDARIIINVIDKFVRELTASAAELSVVTTYTIQGKAEG